MRRTNKQVKESVSLFGVGSLIDVGTTQLLALALGSNLTEKEYRTLAAIMDGRTVQEILQESIVEAYMATGTTHAQALAAILELAKRLAQDTQVSRPRISHLYDVLGACKDMRLLDHEEMYTLLLDTKLGIIGIDKRYKGTVDSSCLRGAEVFKLAVMRSAPNILVVHNHPSGGIVVPSSEDIDVTRQLASAGELLNITLVDHIIIGPNSHYSIKDAHPELFA